MRPWILCWDRKSHKLMIAGMPARELLVYTHITQLINLLHTEFRRKHEKCQRRLSSSELVFKFYFFWAWKKSKFISEHTCTYILLICKISEHYTFTCGVQKKDKYTFLNGPFICVIGTEFCPFCTTYRSQDFSMKFNMFLRNTYMFPWIFFSVFFQTSKYAFWYFQNTELGLQKSALEENTHSKAPTYTCITKHLPTNMVAKWSEARCEPDFRWIDYGHHQTVDNLHLSD